MCAMYFILQCQLTVVLLLNFYCILVSKHLSFLLAICETIFLLYFKGIFNTFKIFYQYIIFKNYSMVKLVLETVLLCKNTMTAVPNFISLVMFL